jgi:hypothetical protein
MNGMNSTQWGDDWTGMVVAVFIALALVAGQYLILRINRAWIRWHTSAITRARSVATELQIDDAYPEDQACSDL